MQAKPRGLARVPGRRACGGCDGCRCLHLADRMGAGLAVEEYRWVADRVEGPCLLHPATRSQR
jgi:hypothetical protein